MTARVLDGKALSQQIIDALRGEISADGLTPGLAVVLVGDDPASAVYVRNKKRACEQAGIASVSHELPASTSEDELLALVRQLNADPTVHGILVQSPLPAHISFERVIETILPGKDVDGFHPYNVGRLVAKLPTLRACTPYGVIRMLEHTGESLVGKDAVIIGQSTIVGRPMALELLLKRCTVTVCHSATRDLESKVGAADIVVAAVGKAAFVPGHWIKPGAIVIDVGINRGADGKLCGDVEYAAAAERAAWITPVPGGVGPMTIAMLMSNTVLACRSTSGAA